MIPTAVLVDGAYFLKRYSSTYGRMHAPKLIAKNLFTMCIEHLDDKHDLYRILFYDCPPLGKKAHNPVTGEAIDFSKTPDFAFRNELHGELVRLRKVALRLGRIGLDIASLAFKRLVRRIVLVTGDSDFVPAAKHARREGIDVILDPMWQQISSDLFEHIDGMKTVCPRPTPRG